MSKNPLPNDFIDRPRWRRFLIDLQVLLRYRAVKTECCETFRKGGIACKGCATRYDRNAANPWYRLLGKIAKRRVVNKQKDQP